MTYGSLGHIDFIFPRGPHSSHSGIPWGLRHEGSRAPPRATGRACILTSLPGGQSVCLGRESHCPRSRFVDSESVLLSDCLHVWDAIALPTDWSVALAMGGWELSSQPVSCSLVAFLCSHSPHLALTPLVRCSPSSQINSVKLFC